ncbi:MAG TPA: hypothetical protein VHG51_19170, partial [Longimicrobiaceae bacterium]|nr:hypothetical protein [Longimicrobiaceae bacterium]
GPLPHRTRGAVIDTPPPGDPLTPARIAVRLAWVAAAAEHVVFDPPRVRLAPGGPVLDDLAAAAEIAALPRPVRVEAAPDGDVLDLRAAGSAAGWEPSGLLVRAEDVRDPAAPTLLAWTAGRGLRVSQRELAGADADFRLVRAGFIAGYGPGDLGPDLAEQLGLPADGLAGLEWVLLAGRPRGPGDPPGGQAPIRRSPGPG